LAPVGTLSGFGPEVLNHFGLQNRLRAVSCVCTKVGSVPTVPF
jgi:hypothetical protein